MWHKCKIVHKVTIYDIAKRLNTTASTVSRALQDHPRISKKMKAQVMALADELHFQPNPVATHLRTGKSSVIGVIVPRIDRNFFASAISGIEQVANKNGYNVILSQSGEHYETEKTIAKTFLNKKVDALIVSLSAETNNYTHFQPFINKGTPIVFFDRVPDGLDVSKVEVNNFEAAYEATKHLIDQGCKKIFHLAGPQTLSVYRNRLQGYLMAMRDNKLIVEENWIFNNAITLETGVLAVEKMVESNDVPDGIYAAGDFSALGVLKALQKAKIKVPEKVAVAGIANEFFAEYIEPQLTTTELFSYKMGETSAEIVIEHLLQDVAERTIHHIQFPPELIIRSSSLKK